MRVEPYLQPDGGVAGIRYKDGGIAQSNRVGGTVQHLADAQAALEMEKRTRDRFRKLARELQAGLEKGLCDELAAEEEEHAAMLETELEQVG